MSIAPEATAKGRETSVQFTALNGIGPERAQSFGNAGFSIGRIGHKEQMECIRKSKAISAGPFPIDDTANVFSREEYVSKPQVPMNDIAGQPRTGVPLQQRVCNRE